MTQISEIHGIPADEFAQRGNSVAGKDFFPYLSATTGEMRLLLARQRAQIFAQFYPEVPQYRQAVAMLNKALNTGLANGVNFVGAIHDDYLQKMARIIDNASKQTAPASRASFIRGDIRKGIGAIIDYDARGKECLKWANTANSNAERKRRVKECEKNFRIEKILNDGIEKSGHHLVYKSIPSAFTMPARVDTKRILHRTGVEGMAIVAKIGNPLMYEWVENGILLKNTQGGIGPVSSPETSVVLAPDPNAVLAKLKNTIEKSNKTQGVGFVITAATAAIVVTLIAAAGKAAAEVLKALRSEESYAMIQAQGFATEAYAAEKGDWNVGAGNPEVSGGISPMLLLGGAAALFFLMDDK